jgi:thiol-disulfide isomerase/thioredoxin
MSNPENSSVWKIFIVYLFLMFLILVTGRAFGQTVVSDKSFYKTQTGITIVEFWAQWNHHNSCEWTVGLKNIKAYRIGIESETAKTYNIKVLPTLIIFDDGDEIARFEGDIKFKLCPKGTPLQVQAVVDKILLE